MLEIYTDGCCLGNQEEKNRGGWGFIAVNNKDDEKSICISSGNIKNTTNQRMELKACIEGMQWAIEKEMENVKIYSDSAYVVNCVKDSWFIKWRSNGWINSKGQPVKNQEMWELFVSLLEKKHFKFDHVKGHSGNKWNEEVDKVARNAAKELSNNS